jgi:DNA-binding NtrC family response regulator
MVRTIVLAGVGRAGVAPGDVTVITAMTGAEALEILGRRSCDAVAIGNVPDLGQAEMIESIRARQPQLPIVVVGEPVADAVRARAWECVPPLAADRLAAALERACEVGWLRREQERLAAPASHAGPREVEATFARGSIREMERLMIVGRLERLNQNRTRSAQSLDISVRTLRNKLREYRTRLGTDGSKPTPLTD